MEDLRKKARKITPFAARRFKSAPPFTMRELIMARRHESRLPMLHQAARLSASLALSGVKGNERTLTPAASKTAFEIANGITAGEGSPAPQDFSFGRSINSM